MEATSLPQAKAVFLKYGVDVDGMTPENVKLGFRRLAKKYHPDIGGNAEVFKEISDAYDILSKYDFSNEKISSSKPFMDRVGFKHKSYFQEKMEEISRGKKNRAQYTIWNFDGHFFRDVITVYGCPELFDEMVEAMLIWKDSYFDCRAIFVQKSKNTKILQLIYLDGKIIHPPIELEHNYFNDNPSNDQQFVRKLPEMLDNI